MRLFLSALLSPNQQININKIDVGRNFARRDVFELTTALESSFFSKEEFWDMAPHIFNAYLSDKKEDDFLKIHDAYKTIDNNNIIIPVECTRSALYIVRNPLDIIGSYSAHSGKTTQTVIENLLDEGYIIKDNEGEYLGTQFPQFLGSWASHVRNWIEPNKPFPVLVVRYEDMIKKPFDTFSSITHFFNLNKKSVDIENAIAAVSFSKLQEQEIQYGFREKILDSTRFFRKGKAGSWREELTEKQIQQIQNKDWELLMRFNYLM